ncbi:MAG: AAA family ATPase [Patescibacteria group bacterium]
MKKILIIGISGSGKSTLAQKLSDHLHIPVIHLDQLFWKPGWIKEEKEVFEKKVLAAIARDRWIIDGNYTNSMEHWIQDADTIFYFDFPVWQCLWNVIKRRIMFHKKTRPDAANGCDEVLDLEFLKFIWNFPKNNALRIESILARQPKEKKIVRFKNYMEIKLFLKNMT